MSQFIGDLPGASLNPEGGFDVTINDPNQVTGNSVVGSDQPDNVNITSIAEYRYHFCSSWW